MTVLNNSPYLDTNSRSEREVRRERAIKRVSAVGRQAGRPAGEVEEIAESLRGAFMMADVIAQFGRVR
jgi:hypothetical protein